MNAKSISKGNPIKTLQKIRRSERGCRYASKVLHRFGAKPLRGDRVSWLRESLPRLARTALHSGNHKYAWALTKTGRELHSSDVAQPERTAPVRTTHAGQLILLVITASDLTFRR